MGGGRGGNGAETTPLFGGGRGGGGRGARGPGPGRGPRGPPPPAGAEATAVGRPGRRTATAAATNPASSASATTPESSHSDSWKPGRPVVRDRTNPMPIPAIVRAPRNQDGTLSARQSATASAQSSSPPAMNRIPM